jgi:hypothetical protein
MKYLNNRLRGHLYIPLVCLAGLAGLSPALAADDAQLISVSITNGTSVMPRRVFTQVWTMKNTGTKAWDTAGGYQLSSLSTPLDL